MPPTVEAERVPGHLGLAPVEACWAAITDVGGVRHGDATAGWLRAWVAVYQPRALLALEVVDAGVPIAAGLIEELRGGRRRFAGSPVTPHRALVCRPGHEAAAWAAVRTWLRDHARDFAELDVEGVAPEHIGVPGARIESSQAFALDLPQTLADLLASRSRNSRQQLGKKLRRFERAGGVVQQVAPEELGPALRRLVALHRRRAAVKGERHAGVDDRMVELLLALGRTGGPVVCAHEARLGDRAIAVGVAIDHDGTTAYLQTGLDPDFADHSPGVCLALGVAEAAMARGARRLDLGPGDFRYKRDIGGVASTHWRVIVASRSARGLVLRAVRTAAARREVEALRRRAAARGSAAA